MWWNGGKDHSHCFPPSSERKRNQDWVWQIPTAHKAAFFRDAQGRIGTGFVRHAQQMSLHQHSPADSDSEGNGCAAGASKASSALHRLAITTCRVSKTVQSYQKQLLGTFDEHAYRTMCRDNFGGEAVQSHDLLQAGISASRREVTHTMLDSNFEDDAALADQ